MNKKLDHGDGIIRSAIDKPLDLQAAWNAGQFALASVPGVAAALIEIRRRNAPATATTSQEAA